MNLWQKLVVLLVFIALFIQDVATKAAKKVVKKAAPAKKAAAPSKKSKKV